MGSEESDVRKHFQQCGEIAAIRLPGNSRGVRMGIAFITFKLPTAVKKALALNGSTFNGNEISVKMQERREKSVKASRKEAKATGEQKKQDGVVETAGEEKLA